MLHLGHKGQESRIFSSLRLAASRVYQSTPAASRIPGQARRIVHRTRILRLSINQHGGKSKDSDVQWCTCSFHTMLCLWKMLKYMALLSVLLLLWVLICHRRRYGFSLLVAPFGRVRSTFPETQGHMSLDFAVGPSLFRLQAQIVCIITGNYIFDI